MASAADIKSGLDDIDYGIPVAPEIIRSRKEAVIVALAVIIIVASAVIFAQLAPAAFNTPHWSVSRILLATDAVVGMSLGIPTFTATVALVRRVVARVKFQRPFLAPELLKAEELRLRILEEKPENVPEGLEDPVMFEPMPYPVILPEGHTIEFGMIEKLETVGYPLQHKNPLTNNPFDPAAVILNLAMQAALEDFLDKGQIDKTAAPYQCALSGALMKDPVVLPDGRSCERGQEPWGTQVIQNFALKTILDA